MTQSNSLPADTERRVSFATHTRPECTAARLTRTLTVSVPLPRPRPPVPVFLHLCPTTSPPLTDVGLTQDSEPLVVVVVGEEGGFA